MTTKAYIGGICAVHRSPLLFQQGEKNQPVTHKCAGPGCVTCLWASHGIVRSWAGHWYGWDGDRSVVIENDKAAVRLLPSELGL